MTASVHNRVTSHSNDPFINRDTGRHVGTEHRMSDYLRPAYRKSLALYVIWKIWSIIFIIGFSRPFSPHFKSGQAVSFNSDHRPTSDRQPFKVLYLIIINSAFLLYAEIL